MANQMSVAAGEESCYRVVASSVEGAGHPLCRFVSPWSTGNAKRKATTFRARWCAGRRRLYFSFEAEDGEIVLGDAADAKQEVLESDRVELFVSMDEALTRYFCLEINPRGTVLDYEARYYRQMNWDWSLESLEIHAKVRAEGYSVAGSLSLDELACLGCVQEDGRGGRSLIAGVYRADFSRAANGEIGRNWITWVDPGTPKPDFHIPTSFGRMVLEEAG